MEITILIITILAFACVWLCSEISLAKALHKIDADSLEFYKGLADRWKERFEDQSKEADKLQRELDDARGMIQTVSAHYADYLKRKAVEA